jgi:AbrB family looped-hinge helix DNA binding protein
MGVTKITDKGRMTIPKDVRDGLGLQPGDLVVVTMDGGHAILYPARGESSEAGPSTDKRTDT